MECANWVEARSSSKKCAIFSNLSQNSSLRKTYWVKEVIFLIFFFSLKREQTLQLASNSSENWNLQKWKRAFLGCLLQACSSRLEIPDGCFVATSLDTQSPWQTEFSTGVSWKLWCIHPFRGNILLFVLSPMAQWFSVVLFTLDLGTFQYTYNNLYTCMAFAFLTCIMYT